MVSEEDKPPMAQKRVSEPEFQIGDFKVSPDPSVYRMKINNADGSKDQE